MPGDDEQLVSRSALRKRKLRHGFKAAAKRQAIAVRRAHGLDDTDEFECHRIAKAEGIFVYTLTLLQPSPHVDHLFDVDPQALSALTVRDGDAVAVLVHDGHSAERQRSSLAHELAHVLLGHEDTPPLNDSGCREMHADVEAEADYLGSVLLVTDDAVMHYARQDVPLEVAASRLGVSVPMMRWRYNDCGARRRLERERALYRR
jgi:Zn-dependent peptidase ImmA (M78 family)